MWDANIRLKKNQYRCALLVICQPALKSLSQCLPGGNIAVVAEVVVDPRVEELLVLVHPHLSNNIRYIKQQTSIFVNMSFVERVHLSNSDQILP